MKHKYFKPLLFTLAFLLFASLCHAKFTVYFKDGTSRDVVKIEFRGKYVDLYLTTGKILTLPENSIDYKVTGIQRPEAEVGESIVGANKPTPKVPEFKPPSQEELQRQWQSSTDNVVTIQDFGSIRKGEEARVVSTSGVSYTVVALGPGGEYKRAVVQGDIFSDFFETRVEKKTSTYTPAIIAPVTPATQQPESSGVDTKVTQPSVAVKESHRTKPSLMVPLCMSVAILGVGFGITIAMAKGSGQKAGKRKKK